jgi:hypothetical protein
MTQRVPAVRSIGASILVCTCVLAIAVLVSGCRKGERDMPPVATPNVSFSKERVAIGSPVKVTYRFQVAANAKFDGDYWVFVHVLNPQGELLWNDDHLPSKATSQWKPGETIEYTRTIFVPNYPHVGEAQVRIGLYSQADGKRLVLAATEASRREYVVAKLDLLPQSENVFLIYKDGWHPAEIASENPMSEWQWTQKRASFSFRNPRKDANFYLEYDARTDLFTPPQQVTIRVGDTVLTSFPANVKEKTLVIYPVSAAQFGQGEMVEMAIEVDKSFKPGGSDPRELGIRVYHAFIEPK